MVEFTINALNQQYLACNCICFQNESFFPCKTNPRKLADYVGQEKKRSLAMYHEIEKHQVFDFTGMKPCYGSTNTTAYMLNCAYFRHQNSIKKLKTAIKKTEGGVYIKFENGNRISVSVYTETVKQILEKDVLKLATFFDAYSPVSVDKLKKAEKEHLSTLIVLENVVQNFKHGFNQLEIPLDPPQ